MTANDGRAASRKVSLDENRLTATIAAVGSVLTDIGADDIPTEVVLNKADRLDALARRRVEHAHPRALLISASTGEGLDELKAAIETRLAQGRRTLDLDIDGADGRGVHWLYEQAEVMSRRDDPDGRVHMTVRARPETLERIARRFGEVARSQA